MKEASSTKASKGVKVGHGKTVEGGQEREPVPFSFPLYVFTKELLGNEKVLLCTDFLDCLHQWSWWSWLATAKDCEDVLKTWKYFACDGDLHLHSFTLPTSLRVKLFECFHVYTPPD